MTTIANASSRLEQLVRDADQAMYRAKSSGGNRVADVAMITEPAQAASWELRV